MRPPLPLAFALTLSILGAPSFAAVSNAPVTAVTLYPGSATILRTAQVAAGATELTVTGLPASFNPETLRVQGGPGVRIGEVVTLDAAASDALNPAEASLAGKIEALRDQQAVVQAEAKSASMVKTYLDRFSGGAGAQPEGAPLNPKALAGVIGTLGKGASDVLIKIQKLAVQERELGRKIAVLERDLERIKSGSSDTRAVTVRLAARNGGPVTLSYQIDNAGWKAGYRAGLDSTASTVELERLATIEQSTGEDWNNVKMTLSTGRPRSSPVGYEAQPWLLSWLPPRPKLQVDLLAKAAPEMNAMAMRAAPAPAPMVDAAAQVVAEVETTFATLFEVPGRVTLAADGRAVTVPLSSQTLAVRQQVKVTPRFERFGVITADAPRPAGVWPAGNIQLFRDGSYIGATAWDIQDARRAEFSFGRDELVNVSAAAVEGKSGSAGMFGNRAGRHSADVFTVINRHKSPMEVLVLESSPVAVSDQVKVQVKFMPKPSVDAWDERRGVVAWKKKLAPGESAKFSVEYEIDYPKEGRLTGMR